jgi:hypothetical protein
VPSLHQRGSSQPARDRPHERVSKPLNASLRELGVFAPDGLDCPEGGTHATLEQALQVASFDALNDGVADVRCEKCGQPVELRPIHAL